MIFNTIEHINFVQMYKIRNKVLLFLLVSIISRISKNIAIKLKCSSVKLILF